MAALFGLRIVARDTQRFRETHRNGRIVAVNLRGRVVTRCGAILVVYRSWFLGHFASGNHAAAPVLGKSAWRTAAGVRWPWRSTSQAWL